MNILGKVADKIESGGYNRKIYKILSYVLAVLGIFVVLGILFPAAVSIILNVIWITLLALVTVFFALGTLVILGMRQEASKLLDILLEGSLTIIDFIDFLKDVYRNFVELLKEFTLYAAPVFAYVLVLIIYVILLVTYKTVGAQYDVTALTIGLTAALVLIIGLLTKPKMEDPYEQRWTKLFVRRFRMAFTDGFEVIIFIFFLTMDATTLFFLPKELNIPIYSQIGDYDLMTRSFVASNHLRITLSLIIAAITTEVIRNVMRVIAVAKKYYAQELALLTLPAKTSELIKRSIRKAFNDAKDDIIMFVTFTTVLFFVFMLFPRLKLLTLVVASMTSFILDIFMKGRLTQRRSDDLISRILIKVFKL